MFFCPKIAYNKYDMQEDTPLCKYLYNMKCFEECLGKLVKHFLKHQCLSVEKKCLVRHLPSITNALKYNYLLQEPHKHLSLEFLLHGTCLK
jgi:hypothetical protein